MSQGISNASLYCQKGVLNKTNESISYIWKWVIKGFSNFSNFKLVFFLRMPFLNIWTRETRKYVYSDSYHKAFFLNYPWFWAHKSLASLLPWSWSWDVIFVILKKSREHFKLSFFTVLHCFLLMKFFCGPEVWRPWSGPPRRPSRPRRSLRRRNCSKTFLTYLQKLSIQVWRLFVLFILFV